MARHGNIAVFVPHIGCLHQCSFCNQRHITGQHRPITPDLVQRICDEAIAKGNVCPETTEIAFFGGSFTAIPRATMISLLEAAYPYVSGKMVSGIRLSTRPDAIDDDILRILKQYGVTTIELGAQSMDDRVLMENGRGHTAEHVKQASKKIRNAGFSLGLQMMTGLPGDTAAGAKETARQLAALMPSCVRIYPTVVIENTLLAEWYREGKYQPPSLEETVHLCAELLDFFEESDIPVIRMGLHSEAAMTEQYVAGAFHPAFRELCESRRWLIRLQRSVPKCRTARIRIHPSKLSQVIGQKRENILAMARQGCTITVLADVNVGLKDMKVEVIE